MNDFPEFSLHTLIFHVTSLCNLRCRHCWQSADLENRQDHKDEKREMILSKDYTRVLQEAMDLGLTCVKFTGGEPFLHPYIIDYLEITDQAKLSVHIETNGTLLDENQAKRLKNLNELLVSISLDGATPATHDRFRGVNGAFDRTIAALKLLAGFKISVQIIMCLHQENVHELDDVVQLGSEHGVSSIKINPVQPLGRGKVFSQGGDALTVPELLQTANYCREKLAPDFPGGLFFSLPMAFRTFKEIRDQQFSVCRLFHILGLMPNGNVSFCGVGNIDDATVFGNIYKDNLADLWQKAPLLVDLRERLPHALKGVCSRCILKAICLGECRAMAYEQTGDLMGAYWICQQAYEAGLFPESRLSPAPG